MKKIARWLLILLACWQVLACHKKQDDTPYTTNVAVSHFVLNADSVTVLYDDNKVTGNRSLLYGVTTAQNGQAYLKLGAGTHNIKILAGSALVKENTLSSVAGKYYTLLLYDSIKNNSVQSALIEDPVAPVDTLAQVRFINTVPGSDTLTVLFKKDSLAIAGTDVYIGKKPVPRYPFSSFRAGSWQVSLIRSGSIIAQLPAFQLQAGKLYSFIARGLKNGTGVYKETVAVVQNN